MDEDQDQPEIEESEDETLGDVADEDIDEGDTEGDEDDQGDDAEGDSEEVDYEGKKYKVPKELKDALLRQSDYTKKTQEIADTRRALQQQQAVIMEQQAFQQAVVPHMAKIAAVDERIGQYAQVDWQTLVAQDPQEAQRHWMAYQQLKDQRQTMQSQLEQANATFQQNTKQNIEAYLQKGLEELNRDIPDFQVVAPKMIAYANKAYGLSQQEIEAVTDPRYLKVLYKAFLYDQLQQQAAPKPKAKATPQAPVPNIKARSSGASKLDLVKDAGKMTADEWARKREAQLMARRGKR